MLKEFKEFVARANVIDFMIFLIIKAVNRMRKQEDPTKKDCPQCLTVIPIAATRCAACCADLLAA